MHRSARRHRVWDSSTASFISALIKPNYEEISAKKARTFRTVQYNSHSTLVTEGLL